MSPFTDTSSKPIQDKTTRWDVSLSENEGDIEYESNRYCAPHR